MQIKELIINNEVIPVSIKRSRIRRKTIRFSITKKWLEIMTPMTYSNSTLKKFFKNEENWIYESWIQQKKTNDNENSNNNTDLEKILYKWDYYLLQIKMRTRKRSRLEFKNKKFTIYIYEKTPREMRGNCINNELNKRYKKMAVEFIKPETEKIARLYGFDLNEIIIKSYKSKYGQCKWKDIYFNYQIIKFPLDIIRHIIFHELCHIKHKNHGKDFRNLLKNLDRDCIKNRKWLKENGLIF